MFIWIDLSTLSGLFIHNYIFMFLNKNVKLKMNKTYDTLCCSCVCFLFPYTPLSTCTDGDNTDRGRVKALKVIKVSYNPITEEVELLVFTPCLRQHTVLVQFIQTVEYDNRPEKSRQTGRTSRGSE